jgi:hypothetical protein
VSLRSCRASRHSSSPGEEGEIGCRSIDSPPAPRHAIICRRCFRARVTRAHHLSSRIWQDTYVHIHAGGSAAVRRVGMCGQQAAPAYCSLVHTAAGTNYLAVRLHCSALEPGCGWEVAWGDVRAAVVEPTRPTRPLFCTVVSEIPIERNSIRHIHTAYQQCIPYRIVRHTKERPTRHTT